MDIRMSVRVSLRLDTVGYDDSVARPMDMF